MLSRASGVCFFKSIVSFDSLSAMSPSFSKLFVATSLVAASLTGAAPTEHLQERSAKNISSKKVILDNDWGTAGFIPFLMALDAGWEVLGLVSDTANSWAEQTGL